MSLAATEIWNWTRFAKTTRLEVLVNGRRFALFALVPALFWAFLLLLRTMQFGAPVEWSDTMMTLISILGIFATSDQFRDEHDPQKGIFKNLLPASTLERFMAKFALSFVIFLVGSLGLMLVLGNLFGTVEAVSKRIGWHFIGPDAKNLTDLLKTYFLSHSIFFCGAVFFRKAAGLKTTLVVLSFLLVVALLFLSTGISWTLLVREGEYGLIPLLLYVIAYLRMRKIEMR